MHFLSAYLLLGHRKLFSIECGGSKSNSAIEFDLLMAHYEEYGDDDENVSNDDQMAK